jgi:hypothetical protein
MKNDLLKVTLCVFICDYTQSFPKERLVKRDNRWFLVSGSFFANEYMHDKSLGFKSIIGRNTNEDLPGYVPS